MKATLLMLGLTAIMSAAPVVANAGDNGTGTVQQALGEQCSIVANVNQDSGGCGGAEGKTVDVSYTIGIQGGKEYAIVASYIDENDNQSQLSPTGDYSTTNPDGSVTLYSDYNQNVMLNAEYVASLGQYQLKLSVINVSTGAEVCSAQSMINVQ